MALQKDNNKGLKDQTTEFRRACVEAVIVIMQKRCRAFGSWGL